MHRSRRTVKKTRKLQETEDAAAQSTFELEPPKSTPPHKSSRIGTPPRLPSNRRSREASKALEEAAASILIGPSPVLEQVDVTFDVYTIRQAIGIAEPCKPKRPLHLEGGDTILLENREWRVNGRSSRHMEWAKVDEMRRAKSLWIEFDLPGMSSGFEGFGEYLMEWITARRAYEDGDEDCRLLNEPIPPMPNNVDGTVDLDDMIRQPTEVSTPPRTQKLTLKFNPSKKSKNPRGLATTTSPPTPGGKMRSFSTRDVTAGALSPISRSSSSSATLKEIPLDSSVPRSAPRSRSGSRESSFRRPSVSPITTEGSDAATSISDSGTSQGNAPVSWCDSSNCVHSNPDPILYPKFLAGLGQLRAHGFGPLDNVVIQLEYFPRRLAPIFLHIVQDWLQWFLGLVTEASRQIPARRIVVIDIPREHMAAA